FALQQQKAGGRERDEAEDREAAERRHVARRLLGPGGADRISRIVGRAQREQETLVDRLRLTLEDLVDELGEYPQAAERKEHRDEHGELVGTDSREDP